MMRSIVQLLKKMLALTEKLKAGVSSEKPPSDEGNGKFDPKNKKWW
jgi:hypothetical protein